MSIQVAELHHRNLLHLLQNQHLRQPLLNRPLLRPLKMISGMIPRFNAQVKVAQKRPLISNVTANYIKSVKRLVVRDLLQKHLSQLHRRNLRHLRLWLVPVME